MNNWNEKKFTRRIQRFIWAGRGKNEKTYRQDKRNHWVLDTERKNTEGKWTAPKGLVGNSQAEQYIMGVQEETGGGGGQRVFEVIWPKTSQTWWKTWM